jgi:hypothetical protein
LLFESKNSFLFLTKAVKAVKIQLFGLFIAFLTYEKFTAFLFAFEKQLFCPGQTPEAKLLCCPPYHFYHVESHVPQVQNNNGIWSPQVSTKEAKQQASLHCTKHNFSQRPKETKEFKSSTKK